MEDWFLTGRVVMLFPLVGLSLMQWSVEGLRFHALNRFFHVPLSRKMAFAGTFRGISVGFIFPNKLGQVVGRLSVIPQGYLRPAVKAHFTGVLIQSAVTLGFGIAGWAYYKQWYGLAAILLVPGGIGAIFWMIWYPGLAKVAGMAIVRYGIILVQYVLVLQPEPVHIPEVVAVVALILAVLSFVPGVILGDLATREALLIALLGGIFDHWALVGCGVIIWLINLLIPACIGGVLWWRSGIRYKTCVAFMTTYKAQIACIKVRRMFRVPWFSKG